ncbi:MAG: STAS domain-containing protein [Bacteroidota bacterium]|nr:STAS domain-containing protein [Bacteroidota bacterium]MDP4215238.1 STAS domain-containing protein [Bacteroidota bacterium]MDP4248099.1 STAS domain-containing protein [Bacteroidota bacterium]MDP4256373.1 STAS domain-containing protein [Bacteroidota bacterium]MDP4258086.1 STAS domain-containing protein [Bacteroidota bacterium]
MQVKIDTKEKFHAITILEEHLAANMTAALDDNLLPILQNDVKNVVLILKDIQIVEDAAARRLVGIQDAFYDSGASFVICELSPEVEKTLENTGLLELLNVVPTASEAGDIVQMEEVERELLNGDDL